MLIYLFRRTSKSVLRSRSVTAQGTSAAASIHCTAINFVEIRQVSGHSYSFHTLSKSTAVPMRTIPLRRCFASTSDDSFASLAEQTDREITTIRNVVFATRNMQELVALREKAAAPNLWDDAISAASVVQRLALLESQTTRVDELLRQFLDTKELHVLAVEERDEPMLRDCIVGMASIRAKTQQLQLDVLLSHESDACSCFVEIQAGAGGIDSCDWTAMLARMYTRWGEARGFQVRYVDEAPGEEAFFRSVMLRLDGEYAYGWARSEAGVHRLVRISPFDSAGRRHTSFAQVRVYPIAAEARLDEKMELSIKNLRVDTFRSSGPGGQHVNSTDSAIRITHLPTGLVVQCQSDRSQHKNKAEAMTMLRSRLYQRNLEEEARKRQQFTKGLGENAWGNQIRSYILNPYQLVKDHRTNYSESNTARVLDGDINKFIEKMLLHKLT